MKPSTYVLIKFSALCPASFQLRKLIVEPSACCIPVIPFHVQAYLHLVQSQMRLVISFQPTSSFGLFYNYKSGFACILCCLELRALLGQVAEQGGAVFPTGVLGAL